MIWITTWSLIGNYISFGITIELKQEKDKTSKVYIRNPIIPTTNQIKGLTAKINSKNYGVETDKSEINLNILKVQKKQTKRSAKWLS